jgi:hypothetical protein
VEKVIEKNTHEPEAKILLEYVMHYRVQASFSCRIFNVLDDSDDAESRGSRGVIGLRSTEYRIGTARMILPKAAPDEDLRTGLPCCT